MGVCFSGIHKWLDIIVYRYRDVYFFFGTIVQFIIHKNEIRNNDFFCVGLLIFLFLDDVIFLTALGDEKKKIAYIEVKNMGAMCIFRV